jgi:hypothetical protein
MTADQDQVTRSRLTSFQYEILARNDIAFMFVTSDLPALFTMMAGGNPYGDRSASEPFCRSMPTADRFELRRLTGTFAGGCRKQHHARDRCRKNHFHDFVAANRWTAEAATIRVHNSPP